MAGYKIPKPFQDEDKWFRFFTKKQILYIGVPVVISVLVIAKLYDAPKIILFLAAMLCISVIMAAIVFSSFKMPKDKYLWGGGTALEKLGVRLIKKQSRNKKVLWVKNYGDHNTPPPNQYKPKFLSKFIKFEDD